MKMKKYRKKTDKQILKTLNENNALTEQELASMLGYKSLLIRLRSMIKNEKVQYIIVPNNTSCKYKMFRGYAGVKLYYIDREHLQNWVNEHIPAKICGEELKAITMRIRRDFKLDDFSLKNSYETLYLKKGEKMP